MIIDSLSNKLYSYSVTTIFSAITKPLEWWVLMRSMSKNKSTIMVYWSIPRVFSSQFFVSWVRTSHFAGSEPEMERSENPVSWPPSGASFKNPYRCPTQKLAQFLATWMVVAGLICTFLNSREQSRIIPCLERITADCWIKRVVWTNLPANGDVTNHFTPRKRFTQGPSERWCLTKSPVPSLLSGERFG